MKETQPSAPAARRMALVGRRSPARGLLATLLVAFVLACSATVWSAAPERGTYQAARAVVKRRAQVRKAAERRKLHASRKLQASRKVQASRVKAKRRAVARRAAERRDAERFSESAQEQEREHEDVEGRLNWFLSKRAYPSGTLPAGARRRAWESRPESDKRGRDPRTLASETWTHIGPAPTTSGFTANWGATSGRINAVAISPANTSVILIGAATGGIWRSADGGQTFAPVSDTQVDLAVGAIAFAPSNPQIVYAGMGDLDNAYLGTGILKSTDGGQTWARINTLTFPEYGYITDIAVSPTDANRVYVTQAAGGSLPLNTPPTSGFFVSTDGGANWSKTLGGNARNLAIHPTNQQTLYVAMRTADNGMTAGVYKSTNAGASWSQIYGSPYGTATRDIRVAVSPHAPERVYVLSGRTGPNELRIAASDNAVEWNNRGVAGIDPGQFGYNTYFYVSPSSADTLYVGVRDIYKTTDGGSVWTNLTKNFHAPSFFYNPTLSNTHPDQQAFAFDPNNPNVIYAGNDGGLSKSDDAGLTFRSLNASLSLTQFVGISLHPTDPNISYGGTQDNGTQRRITGTRQWQEFNEGDGGRSVINPLDPSVVFTTYVYGSVRRNLNNGEPPRVHIANDSTFGEGDPATRRIAFYPPFVGNGVDNKLYFGTYRLFVCSNCHEPTTNTSNANWTAPGGTFDQTRGRPDVLSAIAVARSNTNVIYTGSAQGRAMVSTDGGANWADISAGLPNRFIESIVVDANNSSVAYLSVSGYGTGHVFKTTNSGATWADVSGNLPNTPTSALLIDPRNPNTLYAGTDVGVFRSTSGGGAWETFNAGMPPVVVTAFAAQQSGRIQAATYGRGAYEITPSADPTPTPTPTPTPPFSLVRFPTASVGASETAGKIKVTVNRTDATLAASVDYATSDRTANDRDDYLTAAGTLRFAPGESSRTFDLFITDDAYAEPVENFVVALSNPTNVIIESNGGLTVNVVSDDASTGFSPVREQNFNPGFFVRQHYLDFFNREPDAPGLAFWTNEITSCGSDAGCIDLKKQHVSGAFFLSIEFQETGFLVYRANQAAFNTGERLGLRSFLADTQQIGRGVVIGQPGADALLEANKVAFFDEFVARPAFLGVYPLSMSANQFVAELNGKTGNSLTPTEAATLANRLSSGQMTRAQALRAVAENAEFGRRHKSRAFVLMQYFGYLRREPDAEGFTFWFGKLNNHNGDFIAAQMVRSFIVSGEYIGRFGQP